MKLNITNKSLYWGLIFTFALLYLLVAFVSTLHAIDFFNLSNVPYLAALLGIAYEVGQASVLFSILMTKNKDKFLPWLLMVLLTALQVTANVYASYKHMALSGNDDWTYWYTSILKIFGVQGGNTEMYQVIISWISGALLPIVALGMTALVALNIRLITEGDQTTEEDGGEPIISGVTASDIISEVSKMRPTEEELQEVETILSRKTPTEPSDYKDEIERIKKIMSMKDPIETGAISEDKKKEITPGIEPEEDEEEKKTVEETKEVNKNIKVDVQTPEEELPSGSTSEAILDLDERTQEVFPALSDEEVNEMFLNEIEADSEENDLPLNEEGDNPPEPSIAPSPEPPERGVVPNTNGLVDPPKQPHGESEEQRLERLRQIARSKKKYPTSKKTSR